MFEALYTNYSFTTETAYIYIYLFHFHCKKENLAKLHKRTINYILEKKNYCSGEGLEGNIRTIRASPPKNYNRHLRAAVRKYRLGVYKMKKSKIPKLCQNIGLGKLFLEK